MLKRLTNKKDENKEAARKLLSLEVAEISEISERLFGKLDAKMQALVTLEKRLDSKISLIENLLLRAEKTRLSPRHVPEDRYLEITKLADKGLKIDEIAGILDIPRGEIELILSLRS